MGLAISVADSTFLNAINVAGMRPDLLLIAMVLVSGRTSFGKFMTLAFLLGLIRDFYAAGAIGPSVSVLTQPGVIGINALAFTLIAYILLAFEDLVMLENWTAQMFITFSCSLIYDFLVLLLKLALQYEIGPFAAVAKVTVGISLYTALIAPAAFFFFRKPEVLPYLRLKLKHISENETIPEVKA